MEFYEYYEDGFRHIIDTRESKLQIKVLYNNKIEILDPIENIHMITNIIEDIYSTMKMDKIRISIYLISKLEQDSLCKQWSSKREFIKNLFALMSKNILTILLINNNAIIRDLAKQYYNKLVAT